MKRSALMSLLIALGCFAGFSQTQKKASIVYGDFTLSHVTKNPSLRPNAHKYGVGAGFNLGYGYELNLTNNVTFTPAVELSFTNNGASGEGFVDPYEGYVGVGEMPKNVYVYDSRWCSYWGVNIPLTFGYRYKITDDLSIKLSAGPYVQLPIVFTSYKQPYAFGTDIPVNELKKPEKETYTKELSPKLGYGLFHEMNFGAAVGCSVETGNNLTYNIGLRYPVLSDRICSNTLTVSLGAGYRF